MLYAALIGSVGRAMPFTAASLCCMAVTVWCVAVTLCSALLHGSHVVLCCGCTVLCCSHAVLCWHAASQLAMAAPAAGSPRCRRGGRRQAGRQDEAEVPEQGGDVDDEDAQRVLDLPWELLGGSAGGAGAVALHVVAEGAEAPKQLVADGQPAGRGGGRKTEGLCCQG